MLISSGARNPVLQNGPLLAILVTFGVGGCAQKVKKGYFGEKGVFYPFHPFSPFLGYMVKRTPFWPVFRPILRVYGSKGPKIGLF